MRVFMTGGTGYIGSHIVTGLLARGHEVTMLARNPRKIPLLLDTPGVAIVEGCLDDVAAIRAAMPGHEACIHNALYWEEEPTELELKDTRAAAAIFEAAANAGVGHVIYTSSTAVHRPFHPVMDEAMRLAPTDFYGATKAAGEAFLSAFSYQTGVRGNVVRPGPTVGGPAIDGAPVASDRRLREIVRSALRGDEIRVARHDGRQFIGASDLAKVYSSLLDSDFNRETYLAVAKNWTSWESIARDAVELAHSSSRLVVEEEGLPAAPSLFDVSKIERDFGLTFDSRTAIREHLSYLIASDQPSFGTC